MYRAAMQTNDGGEELNIPAGESFTIGKAGEATTRNFMSVTFGANANLIVQGDVTLSVAETLDAGSSGVLTVDGTLTLNVFVGTAAGTLTVTGTSGSSGTVNIDYDTAESGWQATSNDEAVTLHSQQV
jgi:hypothetical protein